MGNTLWRLDFWRKNVDPDFELDESAGFETGTTEDEMRKRMKVLMRGQKTNGIVCLLLSRDVGDGWVEIDRKSYRPKK